MMRSTATLTLIIFAALVAVAGCGDLAVHDGFLYEPTGMYGLRIYDLY